MKARQTTLHPLVSALALCLAATMPNGFAYAQNKSAAKEAKEAAKAPGPQLGLEQFLEQVRSGNQNYKASSMRKEGAELREGEFKLLTRPNLIASVNHSDSKAETGSPILGDQSKSTSYSLGVQQQTDFGLAAALTYNVATQSSNSTFIQPNEFTTAGPVLQLTQSLWRNWGGSEVEATQDLTEASALASKYGQSFQQTQIQAQAESAYWQLALAREAVSAAKETLALTERSQKWSTQRQRLGLADRADVLNSQAALLARRLEVQVATDQEKTASRNFNTLRGVNEEVVNEQLSPLEPAMIEKLSIPQRAEMRDDVKAAEQQKRIAEAQAFLSKARNTPTLNLVGQLGLNGRDTAAGTAVSEASSFDNRNFAVGIQLNMPLDIGTQSDVRSGYQREAEAADVAYQRLAFENERLWKDLTTLFRDALGRYRLASEMEKAQREKVDYERVRHSRGRTTLMNVILFETDYANAQLARIRAQADVLNTYAQLKTFGGGQ